MYQLAYYVGGKRVQKNFADKAQARRIANQILRGLTHDAEAVEFFLRHHRADRPRLPLSDVSEQFAKSREQSGVSPHYLFICRRFTRKLAEAFPGLCLSDLTRAALDQRMGTLHLGATTKNDMRRVLGTCGNWAEKQGHLLKGSNPFLRMMREKWFNQVGVRPTSSWRCKYRESGMALSVEDVEQIRVVIRAELQQHSSPGGRTAKPFGLLIIFLSVFLSVFALHVLIIGSITVWYLLHPH